MPPTQRVNYFTVTDFILDKEFWELLLEDKKIDYAFAGDEICPETKRRHFQMFVHVPSKLSLKQVLEIWGPRHTELMNGTQAQNYKYCSKDKIAFEIGKKPQRGKRTDLENIKEAIDSGSTCKDISEEYFSQWVHYNKSLDRYIDEHEEERNWVPKVIFIHGPSGCGKTRTAYENNATSIEYDGKFFGNYNGEDTVLFDDVDRDTFKNRQLLLKLLDRYPMKIRMLNKYRNWKPRTIYITSNLNLEDLGWDWDKAIMRRISDVIEMPQDMP